MAYSSNCCSLVDCFAGVIAGRLIIYENQQTAGNKNWPFAASRLMIFSQIQTS